MKKLEPVLEKTRKYGEAFLQFYKEIVLDKDELVEIGDRIKNFLNYGHEKFQKITSEEEQKLISLTLLVKYIQHLIVHGKIEKERLCLSLDFFKNLHTLEVVNCGKVDEIRNAGRIHTIFCENSTVPLTYFRRLLKLHYIRVPAGRIDFSTIPRNTIIDFAFKNAKLRDLSKFLSEPWENVQVFSLRGNKVEDLSYFQRNIPNVVELDLSFNCLDDISVLNTLQKLEVCDVSMNKISSSLSLRCRNLYNLNISHNILSTVDGIIGCQNLRILDISFNKLSSFDQIHRLTRLPNLTNLGIKGNRICKENQETYAKMVRSYFDFQETFSIDGVKYSSKEDEGDEYELMMAEIQKREAEQKEWLKKRKKKGKKGASSSPAEQARMSLGTRDGGYEY